MMRQFLFKCKLPLSSFPGWDANSSHGSPPPPDTHLYTWVKGKSRPKRSNVSCLVKQWGGKA